MPTRVLVVTGVVVALLIAGVVSYFASRAPDGLNRVAEDEGFSRLEKTHVVDKSPMAGYSTRGVGDDRLSGGAAGVTGVLVVLLLAGGLAFVLRRRGPSEDENSEQSAR